jgi:hypothetical protein
MTVSQRPLPPNDPANLPHWEGATRGRLMLQRCKNCNEFRFPATRTCPACRHGDSEWIAASGNGTIESFCIFHKAYWPGFADALPYDVIQVRLDEGIPFMSNSIGIEHNRLRIGMRVKAQFDRVAPGLTLVKFGPAEGE